MKAFAIAVVMTVCFTGCSSTSARRLEVIREGRALLNHPASGDADWEARRVTFLSDAAAEDPTTTGGQ